MSRLRMVMLMLLCISLLLINALAEGQGHSVNISENKFLGTYLVNETGFTLYYYLNDSDEFGASTCYGDCAVTWKPFYAENLTLPESLNPINFATIDRADGLKQNTFKDWPLYLYSGDSAAGDIRGNGLEGDLWHTVDPSNQPELI